jgi:S1-C subfamily serine protease
MKITFKIWLLIFFLIASLVAINPTGYFQQGVIIKTVTQDSSAFDSGMAKGEIIKEINGNSIKSVADYTDVITNLTKILQPINWAIIADGKEYEYSSMVLGFSVDENLTISNVSIAAKEAGLEENLTLEKINDKEIEGIDDFNSIKMELESKIKLEINTNKGKHVFYASSIDFTA